VIRARKAEQMVKIMSREESIEHFKQRPKELQGGTVSVAFIKSSRADLVRLGSPQKEVK